MDESKTNANELNIKLANALSSIDDKNVEIQALNKRIASQNENIIDLKNNLVNKDNLVALQRELDSRDVTIREKDVQIQLLKDKSVSREEYVKVQNELSKKDLQIKRLNEVKDLFFELSDNSFMENQENDSIVNKTSSDDKSLLELNNIKKELELAKENKVKFKIVEDGIDDNAQKDNMEKKLNTDFEDLVNSEIDNFDDLVKSKGSDLSSSSVSDANSNDEIEKLKSELEEYKKQQEELEKYKEVYDKLTAPQLKNLNSIQSQIYHLLPDEAMDTLSVKEFLNDIAFKNLSFGNTKNILKSLERKGYVEVAKKENDIFFWKKLPLPEE